jgi:hypothetical protein
VTARDRRRMMWPWRLQRNELAIRRTVQWQRAGRVGAAPSGLLQAESAVCIVDTVPPYSVCVVRSRAVAWIVLAESLEHYNFSLPESVLVKSAFTNLI